MTYSPLQSDMAYKFSQKIYITSFFFFFLFFFVDTFHFYCAVVGETIPMGLPALALFVLIGFNALYGLIAAVLTALEVGGLTYLCDA